MSKRVALLISSCEDHNGDSHNYRIRSSLEDIAIGAENLDPVEMEKSRDVESLRSVFTAEDDPITKELSAGYWTDGWGVPMQLDRTETADSVKMRIYSSHNAPEGNKWRRLYVDIIFHRLADGKFRVEVRAC